MITKRVISEELEKVLYDKIPVLDHGFIRVVDYMGNDTSIVQAARVSYGAGTKQTNQDKNLIRYLMKNTHSTPFEMCEIKLHVKLPIFVARQWIRHRTANVNEYSARYSIMSSEYYLPAINAIGSQSTSNKQGREEVSVPQELATSVIEIIKNDSERCYDNYMWMINTDGNGIIKDSSRPGIARELARMNLTLNHYTEWYWKIDLHNLLRFIALRNDVHAQYEIREYAKVLSKLVQSWVPMVYDAFIEYVVDGVKLSKTSIDVIKKLLKRENVEQAGSGLSKREWAELMEIIS